MTSESAMRERGLPKARIVGGRALFLIGLLFIASVRAFHAGAQAASASSSIGPEQKPISPEMYSGDESCRSCHEKQFQTYAGSAHHSTSRVADESSIRGDFSGGKNVLRTSNPDLFFRMEHNSHGFFQTAVEGIEPYQTSRTERLDIVVGSGRKGQTFLYWKGDRLFELPISYWVGLGDWANSPGYIDGTANFSRAVIPRCLECHATSFRSLAPPENKYAKSDFIVGLACEKCHGPGREHVLRENSKGARRDGAAILNPAKFARDRQIELCAWCHAGAGQPLAASFAYLPGKALSDYLTLPQPTQSVEVDVHGSQVELLKRSRCFQSSTMTCSTCHDVHVAQHDLKAFSQPCLACHKLQAVGPHDEGGNTLPDNCIDCHMPNQRTSLIVLALNGKRLAPEVRNHWIKVYPQKDSSNR